MKIGWDSADRARGADPTLIERAVVIRGSDDLESRSLTDRSTPVARARFIATRVRDTVSTVIHPRAARQLRRVVEDFVDTVVDALTETIAESLGGGVPR